jgi:hypothetical protein
MGIGNNLASPGQFENRMLINIEPTNISVTLEMDTIKVGQATIKAQQTVVKTYGNGGR